MAVTANVATVGKVPVRGYWIASVYSADASGTEVIKAAPSSGNLYLEHLKIIVDADVTTVTILDAAAILIGPFEVTTAETGGEYTFKFLRPLKITGALNVDTGAAAPICIVAQGFSG